MTDALTLAHDDCEYRRYHPRIDRTVSFRPVSVERDLDRLHSWFTTDHVAEHWDLGAPLPAFHDALAERVEKPHSTSYVGRIDGVPMSYWERYWPSEGPLSDHYDARETDQGIHVLVGPEEYLGHGYATALFRGLMAHAFRHPETDRLVVEPDASNDAVLRVLEKVGFQRQDTFYFPAEEKEAALLTCGRERFEREFAPAQISAGDGGARAVKTDATDASPEVEP